MSTSKRTFWAWTEGTFFGAGFGKPGPGTWGTALAVVMWTALNLALHPTPTALLYWLCGGLAFTLVAGIPAATIVAREYGKEDPGLVVVDEAAGVWLALLGSPFDLAHGLAAFLLFRLFDITKPFPVRKLERLPEGWGIMADDLGAGIYAWLVMQLLHLVHWI